MKSGDFRALEELKGQAAEEIEIASALAEARVIEVCPRKWAEEIAGCAAQIYKDLRDLQAQTAHLDTVAMNAATHAAWRAHFVPPPPLPFPATLLLLEGGLPVEEAAAPEMRDLLLGSLMRALLQMGAAVALSPQRDRPAPRSILIRGWICAEGGRMWFWGTCFSANTGGDLWRPPVFEWRPWVLAVHDDPVSQIAVPLTPRFPHLVLAAIAAKTSTTLVLTGWDPATIRQASRWDRKPKVRGGSGRMPEPYYRIEIKDRIRVEYLDAQPVAPAAVRAEQAYCCDVRRHEKCRIVSGPHPLDAETWADLARKGYLRLHADDQPLARRIRLDRRAITLNPARWYAVKVWEVAAHQRHKDKPYAPAARRVSPED